MSYVGVQIHVGNGRVAATADGVRFGGSDAFPATDAEPARIEIAAWEKDSAEIEVSLREGDTFEVAGQTWRLDAIHDDGRRWYADLTRIA